MKQDSMNTMNIIDLSREKRVELLTQLAAGLLAGGHYTEHKLIPRPLLSDAEALLEAIIAHVEAPNIRNVKLGDAESCGNTVICRKCGRESCLGSDALNDLEFSPDRRAWGSLLLTIAKPTTKLTEEANGSFGGITGFALRIEEGFGRKAEQREPDKFVSLEEVLRGAPIRIPLVDLPHLDQVNPPGTITVKAEVICADGSAIHHRCSAFEFVETEGSPSESAEQSEY